MINTELKAKKGFTIIEVVLVLAIAGLIFLMVFIALPAMQRNQRDTQRRDDMARFNTAVVSYQTNNGNNLPKPNNGVWQGQETFNCGNNDTACRFIKDYLNTSKGGNNTNTFKDPDGEFYNLSIKSWASNLSMPSSLDYTIYLVTGAKCSDETVQSAGSRDFAVLYRLEGAGVTCTDNQ